MRSIVPTEHVRKTHSDAPTIAAFQRHGIVTAMTIAAMELTNRQNTANRREELALVTCSLATMATAYREFTFAVSCWFGREERECFRKFFEC
jgi:hypothetical protein